MNHQSKSTERRLEIQQPEKMVCISQEKLRRMRRGHFAGCGAAFPSFDGKGCSCGSESIDQVLEKVERVGRTITKEMLIDIVYDLLCEELNKQKIETEDIKEKIDHIIVIDVARTIAQAILSMLAGGKG